MYQFLGGDDAGRGDVQGGDTLDVWLTRPDFVSADQPKPFDPVLFPALLQRDEFGFLVRIDADDKLPAVAKRNIVFLAEFVREAIALNAQPRFQGILRVINARVVYAAIARAGSHAQLWKLLDKKNVLPTLGNSTRDRATDD